MTAIIYNTMEDFEANNFWIRDASMFTNPMLWSYFKDLYPKACVIELFIDNECVEVFL